MRSVVLLVALLLVACGPKVMRHPVNHVTPGGVAVWAIGDGFDAVIDAVGVPIGWRVVMELGAVANVDFERRTITVDERLTGLAECALVASRGY